MDAAGEIGGRQRRGRRRRAKVEQVSRRGRLAAEANREVEGREGNEEAVV